MTQTIAAPAPRTLVPPQTRIGPIVVAVGVADEPDVLRAAHALAPASAGGMLVVSVVEPLPAYFSGFEPAILPHAFEAKRAESRLASLTESVHALAGERAGWETEIGYGEPSYAIADMARAHHAPYIVMGIGRHRPLERLLGSETTLRTIRRASCPVLAVGPQFAAQLRNVVVATDFSPASAKAVESVIPLLSSGSTLHLVHVWKPSESTDARLGVLDQAYVLSLPDKFRRLREIVLIPPGVTVKEELREGKPSERVLDYAAAHSADLIVAGRRGMNLLARLMVGSVSTALLRGAVCSVLIAPEPKFADLERFQRLFSGTSESRKPDEWALQLDEFTRRNRGRRTTVEVDDYTLGAQVVETGYALQGATYDPHDRRVELMLGDVGNRMRHVTRSIANVESVVIATDAHGKDMGLHIGHAPGQTILTFSQAVD